MAVNFSAEQYEDAFVPHRLLNWQIPGKYPPRTPSSRSGFTQAVGDDKGTVLPGVQRSDRSPWGNFVGTWDAPKKIPGPRAHVPTGRSAESAKKLTAQKDEAYFVLSGRLKSYKDRHPKAAVEVPECYPRGDEKRLLKAAQCRRPAEAEADAVRRNEELSQKFDSQPPSYENPLDTIGSPTSPKEQEAA